MSKFGKFLGYTPEKKTTVKTEIIAGLVTFLTMCYILTVNPNQILFGGILVPDATDPSIMVPNWTPTSHPLWSSVFMATAFGAIVGTLLMAFLAKMPLAQAPGMGLNSLIGTIMGGGVGFFSYHYEFTIGQAFMMVLISGLIFLLLSVITIKGKSFRELIFDGMPGAVKAAIPVGIGLFIAYIGFQNAGIIVTNQFTQVGFVDLTNWGGQFIQWSGVNFDKLNPSVVTGGFVAMAPAAKTACVALIGVMLIALLDHLKVKGSVIIGILGATLVGIPFGITTADALLGKAPGITWKFWENFANFFNVSDGNTVFGSFASVFTEGFPAGSLFTVIMLIITMCMIDMFDTMGTVVGCCAGIDVLTDENGKPNNLGKIMIADSVATCVGAALGTSTVTTFVESGSGVSSGGRTGVTAFVVAILFLLSIFILPVFATIPSAATASALIYVGILMMKNNVKRIDFSNAINAISAFFTIIIMPLGYSITKGIGLGLIMFTVLSLIAWVVQLIIYACKKNKAAKAAPVAVEANEGEEVAVEAQPELVKPKFPVSVVSIVVTVLFLVYFFVPTVVA